MNDSESEADAPSRFLIGIDLGTTNSALAYVDRSAKKWVVRDLGIEQLVAPGTVERRETLPSFLYEAAEGEFSAGALALPWSEGNPKEAVGVFAREHGAATPGRLIVSAKSWLSHSGVDRTAGLLPWHGADDVERLSTVQASARYLAHLRAAWDWQFPQHPMARQDVTLAVPASFDEVARELTLEAARLAGLGRVVLLEEPQAAFYSWINAHARNWERLVRPGQTILVCDIGGGTSDFTLIHVRPAGGGKVLFHRVAVGEHLILGGDNIDLAIAHHVERKLGRALEPRQWGPLVRACRAVKELLLGPDAPPRAVVNILGGGSRLIGGSTQVELEREEVRGLVLDGFLPIVPLDAEPARRQSGFQEFGLPYAPDAAITRYLAAFLTTHARGDSATRAAGAAGAPHEGAGSTSARDLARPDWVLFNGGLFASPVLRERVLEALAHWFGDAGAKTAASWQARVLENDRLDLAVSRGAAYFGMVQRGHGVRISGGLAHSYYIGVETASGAAMAVCLVPAGVEEGQTVDLPGRTFNLLIRQPAQFPLYSSSARTTDRPGDLLAIDPQRMTPLPPIRTVLQSGKKSGAQTVLVRLHARLTPIGTLEIWCAEVNGDRSWRLQFDVRAATGMNAGSRAPATSGMDAPLRDGAARESAGEAAGVLDERLLESGRQHIRAAFAPTAGAMGAASGGSRGASNAPSAPGAPARAARPESLVKQVEQATGMPRLDWPPTLLRGFWETLMDVQEARKISEIHEARWLNFTGYCLRPGYGLAADDWRVGQTWKLLPAGVAHPKNELVRAEWWILWRRLAGGMSAGQQRTLADPLIADWRTWARKGGSNVRGRSATFQFGPHESAEAWRLLGSLELLPTENKLEIGGFLLERLARESAAHAREAMLFTLGRLGARVPVYGPLNALLAPEIAADWTRRVMAIQRKDEKASFAIVQLCRRTGDRYRDVDEPTRAAALDWLAARGATEHFLHLVREGGQLEAREQGAVFGETLPKGLWIE